MFLYILFYISAIVLNHLFDWEKISSLFFLILFIHLFLSIESKKILISFFFLSHSDKLHQKLKVKKKKKKNFAHLRSERPFLFFFFFFFCKIFINLGKKFQYNFFYWQKKIKMQIWKIVNIPLVKFKMDSLHPIIFFFF